MMKKICFLLAVFAFLFTSCKKDTQFGTGDEFTFVNGRCAVDLGLPSGLKWATCNIGATQPEDFGKYYAWGEVGKKGNYTEDNSDTYGKSINDFSGNPEYDVATAKWGEGWRMPTKDDFQELLDNCIWNKVTQNGVEGHRVTGPNGNSIFLPYAGNKGGPYYKMNSFYWSSTPCDGTCCAYGLEISYYGNNYDNYEERYYGMSVRAVTGVSGDAPNEGEIPEEEETPDNPNEEETYSYVDLGLPSGLKWATCNIGATSPEDYGIGYAWDQWKYSGDHRVPTNSEMNELRNYCTWQWTTINGVSGYNVTGTNGNSIFLPAAGYWDGSIPSYVGSRGYYWTSTPYGEYYAYGLKFDVVSNSIFNDLRTLSCSVRTVKE